MLPYLRSQSTEQAQRQGEGGNGRRETVERGDDRGGTLETDVEDVNREVSRGIIRTL
jgi:hypothetical protein